MIEILINPKVPKWMDSKDIEERSPKHIEKWWNVPYITFETFEKEPYPKFIKRVGKLGISIDESFQEYELRKTRDFQFWLAKWPKGIRYDIRMLDGGAWDRTTWHGSFTTLEEAIESCNELRILV